MCRYDEYEDYRQGMCRYYGCTWRAAVSHQRRHDILSLPRPRELPVHMQVQGLGEALKVYVGGLVKVGLSEGRARIGCLQG